MIEMNSEHALATIRRMKEKQTSILKAFLNDDLSGWKDGISGKEQVELSHLAKFILVYDENITILKKSERPDFVIDRDGKMIGVEHSRIFNPDQVRKVKSRQNILDLAAGEFMKRFPGLNVLVNFRFHKELEIESKNKGTIVDEVIEFVHDRLTGKHSRFPSYIAEAIVCQHSGVAFVYYEGPHTVRDMGYIDLNDAIKEKERKLPTYRSESGLETQWLLITVGIGSDSLNVEDLVVEPEVQSEFEHVFLLDDFGARVTVIK